MLFLETKYANLLNTHLRNFTKKDDYLWNFSCPVCGDSKKNQRKARAYIYQWKDILRVKCHNCDYQAGMRDFLKQVDENLYNDYIVEVFRERDAAKPDLRKSEPKPAPKPDCLDCDHSVGLCRLNEGFPCNERVEEEEIVDTVLDGIKRIDRLPKTHPAREYVTQRRIPESAMKLLYYAPRFKKYINSILPNKFDSLEGDHPRLIIPYFNKHGAVYTLQGRAFGDEELRYITIKLTPDATRIFGLERIDPTKRVYAVEGPLDSLCIPNAIAVSGSSFGSATLELIKSNLTVVFDNEPRNPDINKLLKRTIAKGFSVCIWPSNVGEKDINDMILAGRTAEEIVEVIDTNTFRGAAALLKFSAWSKTDESRKDRKSVSRS